MPKTTGPGSLSAPRRRPAPGECPEVENFLATLHDGERESFLNFAELNVSNYEIWIYATVLGFDGRFVDLESWAVAMFPKINRRDVLLREVGSLESDIAELRELVQLGKVPADSAASRIAQVTKELRGHIIEIEKMSKSIDRRGLVLAGADRVIRELKSIFRGNDEIMEALTPAFASAWAAITEEI
jgi:5'(3')-deoxyribonucleotidase